MISLLVIPAQAGIALDFRLKSDSIKMDSGFGQPFGCQQRRREDGNSKSDSRLRGNDGRKT